ncbi:hypothetical protein B9Q17_03495 [Marinobacter vinifirmus]|jgi:hypothetical protein|uniref:Uncharacterized protein n=1 Tax=Marinobacter vinifirmus TaxID=355591 RepID=A0A7Z1INL8_9GAMM|nr:hypothetical protein [Marinobacter vinifirmus]OZC37194.1 hypothetical protein B9Q17_03495 [Marinobacter vinifirmus]|tara:strand:- start:1318 stop:1887 length:570 start_codon:yes stop_codon:yes gene_type:complete
MHKFLSLNLILTLTLAGMWAPLSCAQEKEYEDHVLADGKLTAEELSLVVRQAQGDLKAMTEASIAQVKDELESSGVFEPNAWMLMKNGELKKIQLGEDAKGAPPEIKVLMYRASLKSVARHGRIDAGLVAYPGTIEKNGMKRRVVAIEHEHRLGVSGIKLVPVTLNSGTAEFRAAVSQDKSFEFFYDGK